MINKVILVGRMTKDVQLRKTQTGKSVAQFTLACNRRKVVGQPDQADFLNCIAWEKSAEFLAQYSQKGDMLGVEGRIQTRTYDDDSGKKIYVTEIQCESVQMLVSTKPKQTQDQPKPKENTPYPPQEEHHDDFNTGPLLDINSDDLPF